MAITRIYLVPLIFFIIMPCTFLVTYCFAVSLDHVYPVFPFISDTGTYPPESCLFGQSLNFMGLLNFVFVWVRYAQVKAQCRTDLAFSFVLKLNNIGYWLGVVTSVGMSFVANFQETNMLLMHCVGAGLLFSPGIAYIWLQAVISFRTKGLITSRFIAIVRLILAVAGTIFLSLMGITAPLSFLMYHGDDFRKWQPHDGGYDLHVICTISEWLLAMGYSVFIVTFVGEFQEIHIETAEIRILRVAAVEELDPSFSSDNQPHQRSSSQSSSLCDEVIVGNQQRSTDEFQTPNSTVPYAELYKPVVVRTEPYRELYA